MNISEQVKELRYSADIFNTVGSAWELNREEVKKLQTMLREAADTIESLSAATQAASMGRPADCGGWIDCKERFPTTEECHKNNCRFILDDGNRRYEGIYDYIDKRFVQFNCNGMQTDKCVIRWHEFPEPYHEP